MKQGQFSQEQIVGILLQAEKGEQTIQTIFWEYTITRKRVPGDHLWPVAPSSCSVYRPYCSQTCLLTR
jgi:hypothetical protein